VQEDKEDSKKKEIFIVLNSLLEELPCLTQDEYKVAPLNIIFLLY